MAVINHKMKHKHIAPVSIADLKVYPFSSIDELLTHVFDDEKVIPGMAIAINSEKVLKSIEDPHTRAIINEATITYADGVGVVKTMEKKLKCKLCKIAGVDLWLSILNQSIPYRSKVLLIGAQPEVIKKTAEILLTRGINVVDYLDGYFAVEDIAVAKVCDNNPDIVIVAQGSPRQEKLIQRLRQSHPNAFYMGVGGSFDVLTDKVKRAPALWIKYNLEWLYRLLADPKRIGRQIKLLKYVYLHFSNRL
jgi:UDP-N-acetyl-D-mannosaminouronate:lipid I N-acetyl-D-mannosaminouronosyltransferase